MANSWRILNITRNLKKVDTALLGLLHAYGCDTSLAQETDAIRQALNQRYSAILALDKLRKTGKVRSL